MATASNKAAAAAKTVAGPTGLFHHAAASSMAVKDHQVLINLYSGSKEGLKIQRGGGTYQSLLRVVGMSENTEGGHCVFKWILQGHFKPPPNATI